MMSVTLQYRVVLEYYFVAQSSTGVVQSSSGVVVVE